MDFEMKIVCISDTHTLHNQITHMLPNADVLVHAGDFSGHGSVYDFQSFSRWIGHVEYKYKAIVIIPGNHDWLAEDDPQMARKIITTGKTKTHFLIDESVVIDGVVFYGSPWQPRFYDWAFNLNRGKPLKDKWDQIPEDTNVLITHGPPATVLDECPRGHGMVENVGCVDLSNRIFNGLPNLKLHVFGHIHDQHGAVVKKNILGQDITYVNACTLNDKYQVAYLPIEITI